MPDITFRTKPEIDTVETIAREIFHIRYGKPGKIMFTFRQRNIAIREPLDVLLVGSPGAALWLSDRYAFLLSVFPKPVVRLRE